MRNHVASATSSSLPTDPIVLVPLGSTEQHGPHLPLDTDAVIATAVANAAVQELGATRGDVVVAPTLNYGSSGEHQAFAGTSSIGTDALHVVLVELVRSMRTWARRVVFVNGHGGNTTALERAIEQLKHEGHPVCWVGCATEGADLHAGRTETSIMMHLAPWNVRLHRAEAGPTAGLLALLPAMRAGGVHAVSANGVLGDPAGASAQEGARMLSDMGREVAHAVAGWAQLS